MSSKREEDMGASPEETEEDFPVADKGSSLPVTAAKFLGAIILLSGIGVLGYYLGHPGAFQ